MSNLIDLQELQKELEAAFAADMTRAGAKEIVRYTAGVRDCSLSSSTIIARHLAKRVERRLADIEQRLAALGK